MLTEPKQASDQGIEAVLVSGHPRRLPAGTRWGQAGVVGTLWGRSDRQDRGDARTVWDSSERHRARSGRVDVGERRSSAGQLIMAILTMIILTKQMSAVRNRPRPPPRRPPADDGRGSSVFACAPRRGPCGDGYRLRASTPSQVRDGCSRLRRREPVGACEGRVSGPTVPPRGSQGPERARHRAVQELYGAVVGGPHADHEAQVAVGPDVRRAGELVAAGPVRPDRQVE